jgi:hypothetical protein
VNSVAFCLCVQQLKEVLVKGEVLQQPLVLVGLLLWVWAVRLHCTGVFKDT